ncbi:MAG TPA: hypothetical protein VG389_26735 [Myxococcota bacterium]|nr:hypothetical protein [Myxococcota bacterium]
MKTPAVLVSKQGALRALADAPTPFSVVARHQVAATASAAVRRGPVARWKIAAAAGFAVLAVVIVASFVLPGGGTPVGGGSVAPLASATPAGPAGSAFSAAPGVPTAAAVATGAPTPAAPTAAPATAAAPTACPRPGPLDRDHVAKVLAALEAELAESAGVRR